jgi:lysozyme family protein
MSFERIFPFTMKWEGWSKETNDPSDPGGLTKFGLSKKANPDLDIANLTLQDAMEVYKKRYWTPIAEGLDDALDMVCFDTAVNCGVGTVKRWLREGIDYRDILEDRRDHYAYLIIKNPKLEKFSKGWLNRVADLEKFILTKGV